MMYPNNVVHDGISSIEVEIDGIAQVFPLDHLFDHVVKVENFKFEDQRIETISIEVRPTNHVYSRALERSDNEKQLSDSGHLLIKYEHHEDRPHIAKLDRYGQKIVSSDKRVFCSEKYLSSQNIPLFVKSLQESSSNFCILANKGDDRTCLTGFFEFEHGESEKHCYVVLFKLHRLSARDLSMVIETAFLVDEDDFRVKLLQGKDTKPFLIAVRNVFAKRPPFQGPALQKSKKGYKKKKKARRKI
ncbi:hypothetical protein [Alteromonas sp. C1M14]|uniref:hypothetical protein n=1 Tax=Alteromonas sp. C1M14 TaxID=2841567 RepID=UPI001C09E339|nr:hypothetical protein [Alteromonas sp. C1M14]MBU2979864.1 hypothetical protein [Alteromonas sp. C1M14]